MGFLKWIKEFKEKRLSEKFKKAKSESNRIIVLGELKRMESNCDSLIVLLSKIQEKVIDSSTMDKLNWFLEKVREVKHSLEDSYSFLKAENIKFVIEELNNVNAILTVKEIDERIDFFIKSKYLKKDDKSRLVYIRSNSQRLTKDIPNLGLI